MNHTRRISYLAGCLLSTMIYALPEDNHAPLEMNAGNVMFDQKNHRGVFIENVALDQGSTHIRANRINTETDEKNQLTKAIIWGEKTTLAHYWVTVSKDKPELHAHAERIEYYPNEHLIKLIGKARIEQGENSFSAAVINYNTETQKVMTENAQRQHERTLMVFHSEKSNKGLNKIELLPTVSEKPQVPVIKQTAKAPI